jgi:hypothetical protein
LSPEKPDVSNSTLIVAASPGLMTEDDSDATVQPHDGLVPIISRFIEPTLRIGKSCATFWPAGTLPKLNAFSGS